MEEKGASAERRRSWKRTLGQREWEESNWRREGRSGKDERSERERDEEGEQIRGAEVECESNEGGDLEGTKDG